MTVFVEQCTPVFEPIDHPRWTICFPVSQALIPRIEAFLPTELRAYLPRTLFHLLYTHPNILGPNYDQIVAHHDVDDAPSHLHLTCLHIIGMIYYLDLSLRWQSCPETYLG
jgi:hypothetical protein